MKICRVGSQLPIIGSEETRIGLRRSSGEQHKVIKAAQELLVGRLKSIFSKLQNNCPHYSVLITEGPT